MPGYASTKEKTPSKAKTKRYAELESPCLVPLYNLKYGVLLRPLTTHNAGFFNQNLHPFAKFVSKSKCF